MAAASKKRRVEVPFDLCADMLRTIASFLEVTEIAQLTRVCQAWKSAVQPITPVHLSRATVTTRHLIVRAQTLADPQFTFFLRTQFKDLCTLVVHVLRSGERIYEQREIDCMHAFFELADSGRLSDAGVSIVALVPPRIRVRYNYSWLPKLIVHNRPDSFYESLYG